MSKADLIQWSGLAAVLGGMLGIMLTPLASSASFIAYGSAPPAWASALGHALEVLLAFGPPSEVYALYGRAYFLVFLLLLAGAAGLHAHFGDATRRQARRAFRLVFAGLALNLAGNLTDYWLGEKVLHQPLWGISFAVFTLLGLGVYLAGSALLGLAAWRAKTLPRLAAAALVLAPPLAVVNSIWGVRHIPSAQVLPEAAAWILVGAYLWLGTRARGQQPQAAARPG